MTKLLQMQTRSLEASRTRRDYIEQDFLSALMSMCADIAPRHEGLAVLIREAAYRAHLLEESPYGGDDEDAYRTYLRQVREDMPSKIFHFCCEAATLLNRKKST